MSNFINYTAVSKLLTGSGGGIRANKCPRKHEHDVAALVSMVEAWADRIIDEGRFANFKPGQTVIVGGHKGYISCTYEGRERVLAVKYYKPRYADGVAISEEIIAGEKLLKVKNAE